MPQHDTTIEVTAEWRGKRLDQLLQASIEGWSRSRLQRAVKSGQVTLDGVAVLRPSEIVRAGQTIHIELDSEREISTDTEGRHIADLVVLHEDDDIIVIDKPAGLVTHPNPRQLAGTVSDLAVARYGPLPEVQGENRPGIVHRLDRLTSGVLVLGRTDHALKHLKAQFKARTIEKTYLAIVHGEPRFQSEWMTGAIGASPKHPDRMHVVPAHVEETLIERGEARRAETLVELQESFGFASLVTAKPKTGRTHQIRVHLLAAGLPIVGDRVYRQGGALKHPLSKSAPRLERPALHASELTLEHPTSGDRMTFSAELPGDITAMLDWLRTTSASDA